MRSEEARLRAEVEAAVRDQAEGRARDAVLGFYAGYLSDGSWYEVSIDSCVVTVDDLDLTLKFPGGLSNG